MTASGGDGTGAALAWVVWALAARWMGAQRIARGAAGALATAVTSIFCRCWGRGSADAHGGVAGESPWVAPPASALSAEARVLGLAAAFGCLATQRSGSGETCSSRRSHLRSAWCLASLIGGFVRSVRRRSARASLVWRLRRCWWSAGLRLTSAAPMLRRGAPGLRRCRSRTRSAHRLGRRWRGESLRRQGLRPF